MSEGVPQLGVHPLTHAARVGFSPLAAVLATLVLLAACTQAPDPAPVAATVERAQPCERGSVASGTEGVLGLTFEGVRLIASAAVIEPADTIVVVVDNIGDIAHEARQGPCRPVVASPKGAAADPADPREVGGLRAAEGSALWTVQPASSEGRTPGRGPGRSASPPGRSARLSGAIDEGVDPASLLGDHEHADDAAVVDHQTGQDVEHPQAGPIGERRDGTSALIGRLGTTPDHPAGSIRGRAPSSDGGQRVAHDHDARAAAAPDGVPDARHGRVVPAGATAATSASVVTG